MYRRFLVPLDGSPLSEAILSHVEPLALALDAEIILLQIVNEPLAEFSIPRSALAPPEQVKRMGVESTAYMKSLCARLERAGVRATYLVREGVVVETILEVAEIMQADAIAMSTHGRSGAGLLLLGSVAYEVVRKSPQPVLMIRPKE